MRALFAAAACAALPAFALGAELPAHLDLQPPFPIVTLQAPQIERIAPGIEYGDYELWSDAGPISVHVVAANLSNPGVRAQTVLGHDVLTSAGETVSAMAQRTGAVAGINGDYFDIGRTNRPTNVVVRNGTLLLTPRNRYALAVLDSASVHFAQFSFTGSVQIGSQRFALEAVNRRPAQPDALTLLTPAFGAVPAAPSMTLIPLSPTTGTLPLATYRVDAYPNAIGASAPAGYYLAAGPGIASDDLPRPGDAIAVSGDLAPIPLAEIADAIGGGPLILYDGQWYDDPSGPSDGAFDRRIPCSGAALESDGTLLLVEVDGRQPQRSVGLTRREFAALMRALGATDGIALDGGGSSALAAQLLGEPEAALQSSPSDAAERSVADGLFLYNVAPIGTPTRLAAAPEMIRAMPGAHVTLHVAAIDANDHASQLTAPLEAVVVPSALGSVVGDHFVARAPGNGWIRFRSASLSGSVPLEVASAPARLVLLPPDADIDPHGLLALHARAFDAAGFELALPARLPWSASSGSVDDLGRFVAAESDADVRLDLGGRTASIRVTVGSHDVPIDVLSALRFLSFPAGGPGSASIDPSCSGCLRLSYTLGGDEHAAYAVVEQALPARAVGMSFDVASDGSGGELRIALRSAINEQILLSALALDRAGRQHVVVRFPQGLAQPLRLVGFYAIETRSVPAVSGSVTIGNIRVLVAGSQ